jgi:hypothetical protein
MFDSDEVHTGAGAQDLWNSTAPKSEICYDQQSSQPVSLGVRHSDFYCQTAVGLLCILSNKRMGL